ncbi:MAG: aromatic-ring-hydroxylating dioxygenase subunit beta [Dehalococcoidia bacterium]
MTTMTQITQQEAELFVSRESRLLDEGKFEEWQKLFTSDGVYWIPMDTDVDPRLEPSVLYDDQDRLAQRIYQLLYTPQWAQRPPSMTAHLLTNVLIDDIEGSDEILLTASLLCHELRGGDHRQLGLGVERALAGRCEYRLRYVEGEGWRMAMKKVILLSRYLPFRNLSFLI